MCLMRGSLLAEEPICLSVIDKQTIANPTQLRIELTALVPNIPSAR